MPRDLSYREEEPQSAASDVSPPSRQRHWMDTRLRTRVRAGGSLYYQQFDYSSTDSDDERQSDILLTSAQVDLNENAVLTPSRKEPAPILEVPTSPLQAMEDLFSENKAVPDTGADTPHSPSHTLANNAGTSLTDMSAPLLTNPSLTDMFSNFHIWPQIDSITEIRDEYVESPPSHDDEATFPVTTLHGDGTFTMSEHTRVARGQKKCRPRGRPPKRIKPRASRLYDLPRRSFRGNTLKRGRPRGRPPRVPPIGQGTSAGLRNITSVDTDSSAPSSAVTSDQEPPPGSTNTPYGFRRNRTPRYRCGTCGLRVCKCNYMVHANFPVKSQKVLLTREVKQSSGNNMFSRLVLRTKKTYTGLQRSVAAHPLEYILARMKSSTIARAPCPRFKEWTHDLQGLELLLLSVPYP